MGEEDPPLVWAGERITLGVPEAESGLPPWAAGAVLAGLYESGIAFRLETDHFRGFAWTWVKQNPSVAPRVLMDHLLDQGRALNQDVESARATDRGQFLEVDWYARGSAATLEGAVAALAREILGKYPSSRFAEWWKRFASSQGLKPTFP